ncbi:hypothetical protein [Catellatospora sp. NPDC049133]|uniref:hypothetical protein n=1 Tax=Catellatospora sp. NPDC049133 TaxID=3155499 RepID=UPI0033FDB05A
MDPVDDAAAADPQGHQWVAVAVQIPVDDETAAEVRRTGVYDGPVEIHVDNIYCARCLLPAKRGGQPCRGEVDVSDVPGMVS